MEECTVFLIHLSYYLLYHLSKPKPELWSVTLIFTIFCCHEMCEKRCWKIIYFILFFLFFNFFMVQTLSPSGPTLWVFQTVPHPTPPPYFFKRMLHLQPHSTRLLCSLGHQDSQKIGASSLMVSRPAVLCCLCVRGLVSAGVCCLVAGSFWQFPFLLRSYHRAAFLAGLLFKFYLIWF